MKKIYFYLITLLILPACNDSTKPDYAMEATTLCNAFNPATWEEDTKKMNPVQMATTLKNKIQSALHSKEMISIYQQLAEEKSLKGYENYAKQVSELIGKNHECEYIKNYFSLN